MWDLWAFKFRPESLDPDRMYAPGSPKPNSSSAIVSSALERSTDVGINGSSISMDVFLGSYELDIRRVGSPKDSIIA